MTPDPMRICPIPRRAVLAGFLLLGAAFPVAADATDPALQFVMFERDGCIYCRRWNEEIAPAYPKTAEGAAAPLRRHDITDPLPADIPLTGRAPVFTPTFVLLRDGTETGRIEGYPGDEFFWVLLADLLARAGWTASPAAPGHPTADRPPEEIP